MGGILGDMGIADRVCWGLVGIWCCSFAQSALAGTCHYDSVSLERATVDVSGCDGRCVERAVGSMGSWRFYAVAQQTDCTSTAQNERQWVQPNRYDPSGIGADVEMVNVPDVLTATEGGADGAEILAQADRVVGKLRGYDLGGSGTVGDVFAVYQDDIADDVDDLIDDALGFGCLSGLGDSFFGFLSSAPGEQQEEFNGLLATLGEEQFEYVCPEGHVCGQGIVGKIVRRVGRTIVSKLLPILGDILGANLMEIALMMQQLCHQKSIEAASQGNVRLLGETVEALYSGNALREYFEGTIGGGGGARAALEEYLSSTGVQQTGDVGALMQQFIVGQVSLGRAGLQQTVEHWGTGAQDEIAEFSGSREPVGPTFGEWRSFRICRSQACSAIYVIADGSCERVHHNSGGPTAMNTCSGWGSVVNGEVVGSQWPAACEALRGTQYQESRVVFTYRQTQLSKPWVWASCEYRTRTDPDPAASGGDTVEASDAPDFYPFDEGSMEGAAEYFVGTCSDDSYGTQERCELAGETWTAGLIPEVDFGQDLILDADDVPARQSSPGVQGQRGHTYVAGRCSVAAATTALDCFIADGVWTPPIGTRPAPAGAATCIAEVAAPTGDAAEGITGAYRKIRSYAVERIRQGSFGVYLCGFFPPEQTSVTELCWPRTGSGFEFASFTVGRLCVLGPNAPDYMEFVWAGLRVLLIASASWGVIRMWV